MKLSLRLIVSLVFSISLVTFVVASAQVRSEKLRLRTELARRAEVLTESLQEAFEPVMQRGSESQIQHFVSRFGDREHLAGVAVYDASGKLLAASTKIEDRAANPPDAFAKSIASGQGVGEFATVGQSSMYVYAWPLHRGTDLAGVLATFYDASYINAESTQIWRETLWHVVAQVLLIVLITYLILRWTVVGPIGKISQW